MNCSVVWPASMLLQRAGRLSGEQSSRFAAESVPGAVRTGRQLHQAQERVPRTDVGRRRVPLRRRKRPTPRRMGQ